MSLPRQTVVTGPFRRFWRIFGSTVYGLSFPMTTWLLPDLAELRAEERLKRGLVVVLPGIQSRSSITVDMVRGLVDGGVDCGIEIWDWTTGWWPLFVYHMNATRRNRAVARRFAHRLALVRRTRPDIPVHLVGYSGGAGLALWILEQLPEDTPLTSAVLLAPAVSPHYDLRPALRRTRRGVWVCSSHLDYFFLTFGTCVVGNLDGPNTTSAGFAGFAGHGTGVRGDGGAHPQYRPIRYEATMAASGHLGGHFGWVNRLFAAERLAPLLKLLLHPASEDPLGPG